VHGQGARERDRVVRSDPGRAHRVDEGGIASHLEEVLARAATSRPAAAASGDEGHESLQDCLRKLVQLLPQVTRGIRRSQTPPTTSGIVADVEKAGFVLRTPDPTDRRRTIVSLVPQQNAALGVWLDGVTAPMVRALDKLSPDERTALLKAMTFLQAELNDGEKALDATGRDRQQP
jgi:hypothetical protein